MREPRSDGVGVLKRWATCGNGRGAGRLPLRCAAGAGAVRALFGRSAPASAAGRAQPVWCRWMQPGHSFEKTTSQALHAGWVGACLAGLWRRALPASLCTLFVCCIRALAAYWSIDMLPPPPSHQTTLWCARSAVVAPGPRQAAGGAGRQRRHRQVAWRARRLTHPLQIGFHFPPSYLWASRRGPGGMGQSASRSCRRAAERNDIDALLQVCKRSGGRAGRAVHLCPASQIPCALGGPPCSRRRCNTQ